MTTRQYSSFAIVFILGLLTMLMPLSIGMYLSALLVTSVQFGVPADSTQMILGTYILGFALGQLIYEPVTDSFGRRPVVLGGMLVLATAAVMCTLVSTIDRLTVVCLFYRLVTAATSVVIDALMRNIYPKGEFSRMMSFVMLVTTITPLMAPIVGGWILMRLGWHYIFWILVLAAILTSAMIFFLTKETLSPKRHQPFHIRTTIGNFAALLRHKRVLSHMLASGFSSAGMFSFLSTGLFVYIEISHTAPESFGYYSVLNIVSLFVMTVFSGRLVHHIDALNMFCSGLQIQFIMTARMVISVLLGLESWSLVAGVATLVGCVSMVSSDAMVVILDEFPHMTGTASSLAGTFRFDIGAIAGTLPSLVTFNSAWPMV